MACGGLEVAKQGSRSFDLDGGARRRLNTTVVDVATGESIKFGFSGLSLGAGGGIPPQRLLGPSGGSRQASAS